MIWPLFLVAFFAPFILYLVVVMGQHIIWEAQTFAKKSADGKHLTQAEFRALLNDAIDSGRVSEKEVRAYVGVSKPSLERWRQGLSAPHPAIRRYVIDYVHGRRTPLRECCR
jgi:hypothetical protein